MTSTINSLPFNFRQRFSADSASPPTELPDHDSFAGYQIASILGQGGMGTVYLARQTSLMCEVAVKIANAARPAGSDVP